MPTSPRGGGEEEQETRHTKWEFPDIIINEEEPESEGMEEN